MEDSRLKRTVFEAAPNRCREEPAGVRGNRSRSILRPAGYPCASPVIVQRGEEPRSFFEHA